MAGGQIVWSSVQTMSHSPPSPAAPLAGVTVLEVANMIAAPGAAAMMADMGAKVIKVEPLTGDILRGMVLGPGVGPDPWFELDNRGKEGLAVDLNRPEGIEIVHHLATTADVFITNLTRDRQERFEMSAESIHKISPSVVHTSLTGYGTEGPEADRLAYDMTAFFARGGIQSLVAEPGGPPAAFRPGQGDHTSSLSILSAVLAALRVRDNTGQGQVVEVALMHVAAWTIGSDLSTTMVTNTNPELHKRSHWPTPLTCRFECGDGKWVALCMPSDTSDWFERFALCLGHSEWATDPRFSDPDARRRHAAELIALCDSVYATADRPEWARRMDEAALTWAPVQSPEELASDPQAEALGILHLIEEHPDGPFFTVNAPFKIRGADVGIRHRAPALGEHSRSILTEAGYDPDRVQSLVDQRIVGVYAASS